MKKLFALAALAALFVASVAGAAPNSVNWTMRPFMLNKTLKHATHAGAADTSVFAFGSGVSSANFDNGTIAIRVYSDTTTLKLGGPSADTTGIGALIWAEATAGTSNTLARDSVACDSIAIEVFLYTQAGLDSLGLKYRQSTAARTQSTLGDTLVACPVVGDSTRYALVDTDDSSSRLDGYFCTSIADSASLYAANKITPEGATSVGQFPYNVSRRIVFAKAAQTYGGTAIPGAWFVNNPDVRQRSSSANRNRLPDRWFYLHLNDAYGGPLRGLHVLNIGVLNRTPSYAYKVSAWLLGASN